MNELRLLHLLAACKALLRVHPFGREAEEVKEAVRQIENPRVSERIEALLSCTNISAPDRSLCVEWAEQAKNTETALLTLLDCPDLHMDNLEKETRSAIERARKVLGI
jgi:hypothetical protein